MWQECDSAFKSVIGIIIYYMVRYPDSKVHGANMGPTWVLSAPDGPHVGPMNLAIRVASPLLRQIQNIMMTDILYADNTHMHTYQQYIEITQCL